MRLSSYITTGPKLGKACILGAQTDKFTEVDCAEKQDVHNYIGI